MDVVDPLLFLNASVHADIEQQRIAMGNRLRLLTLDSPDEDGVMRGWALPDTHPDVVRIAAIHDGLAALEHESAISLRRALRRCSIHPFVKATLGLGEKQAARLLGAIGDPYWHVAQNRPRTVSELWAYSGLHVLPVGLTFRDARWRGADGEHSKPLASHGPHDTRPRIAGERTGALSQHRSDHAEGAPQTGDPGRGCGDTRNHDAGVAARHRRGHQSNWSAEARVRAHLCAVSCIKVPLSPYRAVYLARRERTAETHPDWTGGHSHQDGLRIASKAILRDLWREARRLHDAPPV